MVKKRLLLVIFGLVLLALTDSFGFGQQAGNWLFNQAHAREVVRMSPRIRQYESAVIDGTISVRDMRSLIPKFVVFDEQLDSSGELMDFFGATVGSVGTRIEVAGLEDFRHLSRFDIYTPCAHIDNPDGWRHLGCLSRLTAQATRVAKNDRTDVLRIDKIFSGVFRGQRIIPRISSSTSSISTLYRVTEPVKGQIVDIVDGLAASAQYRVVVVNIGLEDTQLRDGAVLTIYRNNENPESFLPDIRPAWRHSTSSEVLSIGQLVLFDVFEKVSLGLVLRSEKEIVLHDHVRN